MHQAGKKAPGTSVSGPVVVGAVLLAALVAGGVVIMTSSPSQQAECETENGSCAPDATSQLAAETDRSRSAPPSPSGSPAIDSIGRRHAQSANVHVPSFHGVVQDARGWPIAGVEVRVRGDDTLLATTDRSGEFSYTPPAVASSVLNLSRQDYRTETVRLGAPPVAQDDEPWSRVITMTATGRTYPVDGYVISYGSLKPGTVQAYLVSSGNKTRYQAVVADDGYYEFPAVEPGEDYQLRISASPDIRMERRGPLQNLGYTTLQDVHLEALRTADLSIQVLDINGQPVANRALVIEIESDRSLSGQVTTDGAGMVTLEQIPEGRLSLHTMGFPKLEVSDIQFPAWYDTSLTVTLNLGNRALRGTVIDESGMPVSGAVVEISGVENRDEMTSRFTFRTHTGLIGEFRFSELAPGKHELRVSSPRFEQLAVEAAAEDSPMTLVLHEG